MTWSRRSENVETIAGRSDSPVYEPGTVRGPPTAARGYHCESDEHCTATKNERTTPDRMMTALWLLRA